jgi:hypothetical protein
LPSGISLISNKRISSGEQCAGPDIAGIERDGAQQPFRRLIVIPELELDLSPEHIPPAKRRVLWTQLLAERERLIDLAARYRIPTIYYATEFTKAGGLMSYTGSFAATYRQAGLFVGRILKGEKPADLPVVQTTKFEFVINMKTAKALGLSVPTSMQLFADEVIE